MKREAHRAFHVVAVRERRERGERERRERGEREKRERRERGERERRETVKFIPRRIGDCLRCSNFLPPLSRVLLAFRAWTGRRHVASFVVAESLLSRQFPYYRILPPLRGLNWRRTTPPPPLLIYSCLLLLLLPPCSGGHFWERGPGR